MVSKRQKLARKRCKEEHPEMFPAVDQPVTKTQKPKVRKIGKKKGFKPKRGGDETTQTRKSKSNGVKRHPLRVPGMKPGESCFICKGQDHIAKLCPKKDEWEKNKICLLCRRRGHSLKNCPNKGEGNDKKYCYNCGESGHSLSKCSQPLQDGGTKFATCFICNEHGHLSRNCPKNTRGIYPKGGSCKICGGVTHLAKDCPDKGKNRTDTGVDKSMRSKLFDIGQGQKITFASGDDLEDDFVDESNKHSKNDTTVHEDTGKNTVQNPKRKQGPKVVKFPG